MSSTKVVNTAAIREKESAISSGALPKSQNKLDSIREQLGKPLTNSQAQESSNASWGETHRLMALYLTGKLSSNQLNFKLRAHNSVIADTFVKHTRNDQTRQIDVKETPRANMGNPGGEIRRDTENKPEPKTAGEAKHQAKDCDDEIKKRKLEQQQKRIEQKEYHQKVIITNIFERENQDIKGAHRLHEEQRKEKEAEEDRIMQENAEEEIQQHLGKKAKRKGLGSRVRLFVGRFIKKSMEMLLGGAKQQDR